MTIYTDKSAAGLNVDKLEKGTEDNYFNFDTDHVDGRFQRDDGGGAKWNAWYYLLGSTLTDNDDFFARFRFTTPATWGTSGNISQCNALFGFINSAETDTDGNWLACRIDSNDPATGHGANILATDATAYGGVNVYALATSTEYEVEIVYNSTTRTLTSTLILNGATVDTYVTGAMVAGKTFSVNSVGLFSLSPSGGASGVIFDGTFEIELIWANSGLVQESVAGVQSLNVILQLKQPDQASYFDMSDYLMSAKIEREFNAADLATISLMNPVDAILPLLTPNAEVKLRFGFGHITAHELFIGYIPPHPDYANKVVIAGKDVGAMRLEEIGLFGVAMEVIDPASADAEDFQETEESSEQEDAFKAQKYMMNHNNPDFPYKIGEDTIEIQAYAYINKLQEEKERFDDLNNLDGMECFAAAAMLVDSLTEDVLEFAGSGSSPPRYLGDTKTDWISKLKILQDIIMKRLDRQDELPNKPRNDFFLQNNHGKPSLQIKPYPSIDVDPLVIKTIAETEILDIRRTDDKYAIDLADGLWVDLGDVVYLDTDERGLRGYHIISKEDILISTTTYNVTLYLDRPARVA